MTRNIRWGIIGCGDVTEVKSGPAFQKAENSELVAVMRRSADKAEDYAKRHGVKKWYSNADDLINDHEVDAVYVATPPSSHVEYTIKALKAGKPVYVEKPMALDYDECQQMIAASKQSGQKLFVAYYRRYLPSFLKVKELVENGAIGKLKMLDLKLYLKAKDAELDTDKINGWRVDPSVSGGGHFHDLASHQLDYLEYLLGEIGEVKSHYHNQAKLYNAPDTVSLSMKFKSGIVGSGSWCFTVPENAQKDECVLIGEKGTISFSFFWNAKVTLDVVGEQQQVYEIPHPEHVQQPLIQQVVNDLLGAGDCLSTGETGARASLLMDKVFEK